MERQLILEGILDVEDAHLAVAHGADVVVVRNHGGRGLDGAPPRGCGGVTGRSLDGWRHPDRPGYAEGLRLGARGTPIGRAMAYVLAAQGETGVLRVLEMLHKELDTSMASSGHTDIGCVDRPILFGRRT